MISDKNSSKHHSTAPHHSRPHTDREDRIYASLLTDGTITLRALEPTDIDVMWQWENDCLTWQATDTMAPYSRHLLWQYLKSYEPNIYSTGNLRLAVTLSTTGEVVGLLDLGHFDPLNNRCEVGLLIAGKHTGLGYGQRTVRLAMRYAREHLALKQAYVIVRTDNEPCLRVFEGNGFERCGLLKQWIRRGKRYHDAVIMQKLL